MFRQPTKVCTADYDSGVQYFIFAVLSEEARRLILVESAYNLRYAASTCICAARCLVLAVSAYTTLAGVFSDSARCLRSPFSCPSAQDFWSALRPTVSGVQDCINMLSSPLCPSSPTSRPCRVRLQLRRAVPTMLPFSRFPVLPFSFSAHCLFYGAAGWCYKELQNVYKLMRIDLTGRGGTIVKIISKQQTIFCGLCKSRRGCRP